MKNEFDALVEHLLDGKLLLEEAVGILERRMIQRALERAAGKQTAASKILGIHRNTLSRKVGDLGLDHRPKRRTRAAR